MWSANPFKKHIKLTLLALSLCLVFAQALETQHDHQTFNTDCYLCQHTPAIACGEKLPNIKPPSIQPWQETAPYLRYHRSLEKRGKRDPPPLTPITA